MRGRAGSAAVLLISLCSVSCKAVSSHPPSSFRRAGYLLQRVAADLDRCSSSGRKECPFDSIGLPMEGPWGTIAAMTADEIRLDEYRLRFLPAGAGYCLVAMVEPETEEAPRPLNRWRNHAGREGVYFVGSAVPPAECTGER